MSIRNLPSTKNLIIFIYLLFKHILSKQKKSIFFSYFIDMQFKHISIFQSCYLSMSLFLQIDKISFPFRYTLLWTHFSFSVNNFRFHVFEQKKNLHLYFPYFLPFIQNISIADFGRKIIFRKCNFKMKRKNSFKSVYEEFSSWIAQFKNWIFI